MRSRHIRYSVVLLLAWLCLPVVAARAQSSDAPPATPDTLLDGTALNDVWLHINARDWENIHANYLEGTYYPIDFEWHGVRVRNSGIRVRGHFTRNDRKPSFRVDFNRYVTGQNFFGLKTLVLNSGWQDPSMLHDRLSMALFRRMGIPAPRIAHVRLYVGTNREFAGVYAVEEEVNKEFLDSNFGEDDGYLYEYHRQENYGFEDPGPDLGWYRPRFDPKTHDNDSTFGLYVPIRDLVEAVNVARQSDLEDKLADYFSVNTFITEIAIQNFLAQKDGLLGDFGMNNFYLYRFAGTHLSQLIPWDQDQSFSSLDAPPWQNMSTNVLAAKIWDGPKYRNIYLKKLLEIADLAGPPVDTPGVGGGWLEQETFREYAQISDAVHADPLAPYSADEFEQGIALIEQFARERANVVRQYVARVAPELFSASRR
jgi:spore coat protein CotH